MRDQLAEHASPPRQVADLVAIVLVDADRYEPLELGPRLVGHAKCGVARSGQLAGGLEHATEHQLEVELGQNIAREPNRIERIRGILCFAVAQCRQELSNIFTSAGTRPELRVGSQHYQCPFARLWKSTDRAFGNDRMSGLRLSV
jgi:hypothetical protein